MSLVFEINSTGRLCRNRSSAGVSPVAVRGCRTTRARRPRYYGAVRRCASTMTIHAKLAGGLQRLRVHTQPRLNDIPNTITRDELVQLAVRRYDGPVWLIATTHDLERALHDIRREHVVGLDTETQPAFRKGQFHLPSLVQVATARAVYLFQLKRLEFSGALAEVLEIPRSSRRASVLPTIY